MRHPSVDDVRPFHSSRERRYAALHFRDHAAGDDAVIYERLDFRSRYAGDEGRRVAGVAQNAGHVRKLYEFFRMQRNGDFGGGGIRVDMRGIPLYTSTLCHLLTAQHITLRNNIK